MEKQPLYINGKEAGSLAIYTDGLMTCLEAQCENIGGLVKLYVFGGGESAYLGTMQPNGNKLHLRKSFSRNEFNKLPKPIEYVSNEALEKETEKADEEDDGLLWFSTANGYLTCFDGQQSLIAFPTDGARLPNGGVMRIINGKEYAVFPGKRNSSLGGNFP